MTTPGSSASTARVGIGPSPSAFRNAAIVGTLLQLAMVLSGHWIEFIKVNVFAIGGMLISAIAVVLYARAARLNRTPSPVHGREASTGDVRWMSSVDTTEAAVHVVNAAIKYWMTTDNVV